MNTLAQRRHASLRTAARWLAAAYLLSLTLIAFWPTPVDRGAHGTIVTVLARLHAQGVPNWINYTLVEFTANIALFVPVGLLGVVLLGRHRWLSATVSGFVASVAIELSQLIFLPSRFATPLDVIANTGGAALGAGLAVLLLTAVTARSRTPSTAY